MLLSRPINIRTYVGYSKIIGYVPHAAVKDIMSQQDCLGIRVKCVSNIQEYDLEIKPTKLIKGQGLAKMLTQGNEKALGIICQNSDSKQSVSDELQRLEQHLGIPTSYFSSVTLHALITYLSIKEEH